jgi:uncharacterized protein (DUF983 family)
LYDALRRTFLKRLAAIATLRCPRCFEGKVFRGLLAMNERCPVCDLKFEREPGYFYGAMYFSYAFALLSTFYWLPMLLMGVNPWLVVGLPAVQLVVQIPITFKYSRVMWLHLDHRFDPTVPHGDGQAAGRAGGS